MLVAYRNNLNMVVVESGLKHYGRTGSDPYYKLPFQALLNSFGPCAGWSESDARTNLSSKAVEWMPRVIRIA